MSCVTGLGAEDCFAALISSNYELLKKVDAKILRKFVEFVEELGPDAAFLRFMQSRESAEKTRDPQSTDRVCETLFDTTLSV